MKPSLQAIGISLILGCPSAFCAETLTGDTTIYQSGSEEGNLAIEGPVLNLGIDTNYNYGGITFLYDSSSGYSLSLLGESPVRWLWGSDYNGSGSVVPQMDLSDDNLLTIYQPDTYYANPRIVLDPGGAYSGQDPKILIGGSEVVTAASAATLLAGNYLAALPDGALLLSGGHGTGTIPASGAGNRMMWYSGKSAFRAGAAGSANWTDANIGVYSAALNYDTKASGPYSTATGHLSVASGIASFSAGRGAAAGTFSFAGGLNANAAGYASVAFGEYTSASARSSAAFGRYSEGRNATGTSGSSTWVGDNQHAVLEVGIGTSAATRKNALTVLQDGSVEVGKATAADNSVPLTVNADGSVVLAKAQGDISMGIYGSE